MFVNLEHLIPLGVISACHTVLRWLTAIRSLEDILSGVFYSHDCDRPIHLGLAESEACLFVSSTPAV